MKLLSRYFSACCVILAALFINSISIAADAQHFDIIGDTEMDVVTGEIGPAIENLDEFVEEEELEDHKPDGVLDKLKPEDEPVGIVEDIEPKESKSFTVEEGKKSAGNTPNGVGEEIEPEISKPDKVVEERQAEGNESNERAEEGTTGETEPIEVIKEEVKPTEVVEEITTDEDKPDIVVYEKEPKEPKPQAIEPLYVYSLTKIESGHNDSNPVLSPSGGMIAFERSIGDKKEIIITRLTGSIVQKIYCQLPEDDDEMSFFFPGIYEEVSYNAGVTWSPDGDHFVFMSNGGGGNYDLYLCELGNKKITRLTEHNGKDGHAQWSPVADRLVFVSGQTGKADIYLMNLATKSTLRLTKGAKAYLYPLWSPDGKKIVMLYGSNENHDIYLMDDVTKPAETLKALTTWTYDDLRPIWSPDGKKIAFYSNYNPENDRNAWSIIVITANGSDPTEGEGLAAKVVASDVVPDMERGPAWMPDSTRIVYAKDDRHAYNPLYIVDIDKKTNLRLKTDTKMNHDVVCSVDGTIAFRAQVEQWDHIYIAKLRE